MLIISKHCTTAFIEIPEKFDTLNTCIAQTNSSWGDVHSPITIIQHSVITDFSKGFNRSIIKITLGENLHWHIFCKLYLDFVSNSFHLPADETT